MRRMSLSPREPPRSPSPPSPRTFTRSKRSRSSLPAGPEAPRRGRTVVRTAVAEPLAGPGMPGWPTESAPEAPASTVSARSTGATAATVALSSGERPTSVPGKEPAATDCGSGAPCRSVALIKRFGGTHSHGAYDHSPRPRDEQGRSHVAHVARANVLRHMLWPCPSMPEHARACADARAARRVSADVASGLPQVATPDGYPGQMGLLEQVWPPPMTMEEQQYL